MLKTHAKKKRRQRNLGGPCQEGKVRPENPGVTLIPALESKKRLQVRGTHPERKKVAIWEGRGFHAETGISAWVCTSGKLRVSTKIKLREQEVLCDSSMNGINLPKKKHEKCSTWNQEGKKGARAGVNNRDVGTGGGVGQGRKLDQINKGGVGSEVHDYLRRLLPKIVKKVSYTLQKLAYEGLLEPTRRRGPAGKKSK